MTTKDIDSLKGIINKKQKEKIDKGKAAIIIKKAVAKAKQEKEDKGFSRAIISEESPRALRQEFEEISENEKKSITKVKKIIKKVLKPVVHEVDAPPIGEPIIHEVDLEALKLEAEKAALIEKKKAELKALQK